MKWMKFVVMAVVILVLVGVGYFVLYDVAYSKGEDVGYNSGYSEGYPVGREAGYNSGEVDGYNSGRQEGYTEGYNSGQQEGYTEGYDLGQDDGYEEGIEAGLGHGYVLKDPTYDEVITFLGQDKTDENEYDEDAYGVYVCSHFARDVCNNAEALGLRCAFVELRYIGGGHAIVAFDTIDEGLVYFEPITDARVKPVIGKRYYQCIETEPGYYYEPPPSDDTIRDILVIW